MTEVHSHPASFRDPDSGVIIQGNRVFRFFTKRGVADFQAASQSGLLDRLVESGMLIPFQSVDVSEIPGLHQAVPSDAVVVEHEKLPFVSYVYEWPFEMLRAAAMLHLEVLACALENGFTLKDASTYNVQFVGPRPVFIDLGSFTRYQDGQPWTAYGQFCRMFLNPLILYSLTGTRYHPWMRSSLEGISPTELSGLLGLPRKLRPLVFTNVVLQALLQRQFASVTPDQMGIKPKLSRESILRRVRGLQKGISRLKGPTSDSVWTTYETTNSYSSEAREQKATFVDRFLTEARPQTLWDLGCNLGEYSRIASKHADVVVAMDSDAQTADLLYRRVRGSDPKILPLVMDLLNPSPSQGWAECERQSLSARGKADAVLALALIHHIRISGNVPVRAFVAWLASITRAGILEFVPKSDPMVGKLLAWREDIYADYDEASVEEALRERFRLKDTCRLSGSQRVLYAFEDRR